MYHLANFSEAQFIGLTLPEEVLGFLKVGLPRTAYPLFAFGNEVGALLQRACETYKLPQIYQKYIVIGIYEYGIICIDSLSHGIFFINPDENSVLFVNDSLISCLQFLLIYRDFREKAWITRDKVKFYNLMSATKDTLEKIDSKGFNGPIWKNQVSDYYWTRP